MAKTKEPVSKADKIRSHREQSVAVSKGAISKTKQDNLDRIAALKGNAKNKLKKPR